MFGLLALLIVESPRAQTTHSVDSYNFRELHRYAGEYA
jgi:hypothetical protein